MNPANAIAIVGMAGRFPKARDIDTFWNNLLEGRVAYSELDEAELRENGVPERMLANPDFVRKSYDVDGIEEFDAGLFGFTPREAEITDPQQRMLLECCHEALENAGYAPEHYSGAIGVYAGVGTMWYYMRNLSADPDLLESVGTLRMSIGNEKSFASTMVSYKLDLRGPSVNVDTACSTSLVAVHQACQSLLNHECDMALAGGVSLDVPQRTGMLYREGSIVSRDGLCRPFDADATGTVKGNGAGIVVLKRLEEALADGDYIHAVIRGSAVNNDGAHKVGYTASSSDGQAEVIADALARADVDPSTIGYVEAHGTGTILGDPIEVAALSEVYGEFADATGYCALGSVKSNIGHLDIAAGVAGLIKAVQTVHHGVIAPTAHYRTPNPNIDFASSPFFVADQRRDWRQADGPRRAAVSSFGIGGTNAHVVIEQAPERPLRPSTRDVTVLPLSARSGAALEAMATRLADHLQRHPEVPLPDVAYTLQQGRRTHPYRVAACGRDMDEAIESLRNAARSALRSEAVKDAPDVCFMFPGQGSQHPGMARDLYARDPAFREAFDRCADGFVAALGRDLREVVFADGDEACAALNDTLLAQPSLFAVEYAMARAWMAHGLVPKAMIGHSIGEYVAACIAGVFSLEDAIGLVATRARLMQSLPAGAMLMVHLPEAEALNRLTPACSLAAVNGPSMCVISGSEEAVSALEDTLSMEGIESRRLKTSHAFHSWMMEPVLDAFSQAVARVRLQPPSMPYVSNVTGTWITAGEAVDPGYWVRHLRGTVRFGDGLATVMTQSARVLLEVGPGQVLTTLARRSFSAGVRAVPSARHAQDRRDDRIGFMQAFGQLWAAGVKVEWARARDGETGLRVPLPTYPFERKRYWIDAKPRAIAATAGTGSSAVSATDAAHGAMETASDPAADAERAGIEAMTQQARLLEAWRRSFGIADLSDEDHFFELGGDSLLATQLTATVRDQLGIDLSLSDLYDHPRFGDLCVHLRGKGIDLDDRPALRASTLRIAPDLAQRHAPFPLTDIQQAYWVGRSGAVELGQVATHIYLEVAIKDGEIPRFNRAWNRLIAHHDMLRAVFLPSGEQQILAEVPEYVFEELDLRGHAESDAESEAMALRERMSHQVLPADQWPLFDIKAIRFGERRFRLCISIDILLVDAWSMNMLIEQWLQLYVDSDKALPSVAFSFRDYVIAEHAQREGPEFKRSERYWFDRIEHLPGAPDLPLAISPSALTDIRFVRRMRTMAPERWSALKKRAISLGLTPSGLLLTAFSEVLARWSRSGRFCVNLTMYARQPFHEDVDNIVGDFTSLTLLEVNHAERRPFVTNAERIQRQLWADLDHRHVGAIHLLREMSRRNGSRVAMPVVFTSTLGVRTLEHENEALKDFGEEVFGVSQTSQVWLDHQVMEWNGALRFNWDSVDALFPEGMIEDMFQSYCTFIERLVDEEALWQDVAGEQLLPDAHARVLGEVNATAAPFALEPLHVPFERQAARAPEAPAVIAGDRTLSYGELHALSQSLAHALRDAGVGRAEIVGIFLEKGWEQVVAVMGILAAGGAYLPIDPSLPAERLQWVLENSGARFIVGRADLFDRLPADVPVKGLIDVAVLTPVTPGTPALAPLQSLDDLAYVIYTSGSTGRPKGVMVPHRGAANTVADINPRVGLGPDDRVFGISALNFDLSVYDLFGTLSCGAALVLPGPDELRQPDAWARLIDAHGVSFWNSVPALMQMLVDHVADSGVALRRPLRQVMMSGDWIPPALPQRMHALWPETAVLGAGGPTECSIWSACHPVQPEDWSKESIPYGRALANQQIHILDECLQPCPLWVPGELYVAGDGLALGYLNDPEKTDALFLTHPRTGQRLYRSGDLGRYLPHGDIEFLGRNDFQVKINGYRVELGEVEAAIKACSGYQDVVVVAAAEEGRKNRSRLVAYVVDPGAADPSAAGSDARMPGVSVADRPQDGAGQGSHQDDLAAEQETHAKLVAFKLTKPGLRRGREGEIELALPAVKHDVEAYRRRKSYREFLQGEGAAVSLAALAETLGCLSELHADDMPLPKYRYASAGSLHAVQVYVYVKAGRVDGLDEGAYYYHPERHALVRLPGADALTVASYGRGENPQLFERSGFSVFFVGQLDAVAPVYGEETAREFVGIEAGYMGQLLMETAPKHLVGLCPIGYLDENVRALLGLEPRQILVHSMVGGAISPAHVDSWTGLLNQPQPAARGGSAVIEELRDALRAVLPDYMIPASIVPLPALPLTANGKVDRRTLSERGVQSTAPRTVKPPRNDAERRLVEIWSEALGIQAIDPDDNFFELGGDSVLIVRMHKRLIAAFGEGVSIVDLFKYPRISELAAFLSRDAAQPVAAQDAEAEADAAADRRKAALMRQRRLATSGADHE